MEKHIAKLLMIGFLVTACQSRGQTNQPVITASETHHPATSTAAVMPDKDTIAPDATTSIPDTSTPTLAPTTTKLIPSVNPETVGTPRPLGFEPVKHNDDWQPIIQEIDGVVMALVPAGCFEMGSTDKQVDYAMQMCEELRGPGNCQRSYYQVEQPNHLQCFEEPFWIDVYEVTNLQYGSSGAWAGDDLPRERVSWVDAVSFCQSRGGRLPTEAEWEYAARGPDGLVYPWGNEFKRSLLNSCDKSCEWNLIGTRIDDGYPNTAPVGSYPEGASWVGAMDMSGNVWEWTSSINMDYPYNAADGREEDGIDTGSSRRVVRGGSWFHTGACLLRSAARYGVMPDAVDYFYGFRCLIPLTKDNLSVIMGD